MHKRSCIWYIATWHTSSVWLKNSHKSYYRSGYFLCRHTLPMSCHPSTVTKPVVNTWKIQLTLTEHPQYVKHYSKYISFSRNIIFMPTILSFLLRKGLDRCKKTLKNMPTATELGRVETGFELLYSVFRSHVFNHWTALKVKWKFWLNNCYKRSS